MRARGGGTRSIATKPRHQYDDEVDGVDALHRQLSRVPPGTTLRLRIVRRTQLLDVSLTAREPP